MLFISKLDGKLSCSEHDPCGPDPLEPGEIREYVPNMTSVRPRAAAVPVSPSLVLKSKSACSSASICSSPDQMAPARQEPPPRLYINTKTATSSFVPSSRTYLTNSAEGNTFSTPTSSKDELEDGEVCGLDVGEVEDDDDDDDESDDDDDGDDDGDGDGDEEEAEEEMEEMEIVEDEGEDEPLYGGDLIEEDDEEEEDDDDEGADVYETWGDYDEDADDGEVKGDESEEWGTVEDDDK